MILPVLLTNIITRCVLSMMKSPIWGRIHFFFYIDLINTQMQQKIHTKPKEMKIVQIQAFYLGINFFNLFKRIKKYQWDIQGKGKSTITDKL